MKQIIALLSVVLILGCVSSTAKNTGNATSGLIIENGDHVAVEYTGTLENGTVFDSSAGKMPLEFDAGKGQMIKGFDQAVIGMREGEEKTVTIKPEDGYGIPDPKNIIEVPISIVPNGTKAGDMLYAGAQRVRVVEIRNDTVLLDANHFLAGKTLIFKIKIVRIEKN